MSNTMQNTKAFNGVIGTDFAPLNDLDNRFLIKISDRLNDDLRNELARYATEVNKGNEHSAAVTKTREGGPYASILKDTISGREFAVIAYRSLDKNYPDTMPPADPYISTNYTIGELVGQKIIGTPAEAMAKIGLQEDMGFPVDKKSDAPGNEQWWLTQGLQNMIKQHQKESRLELEEVGEKVDQRSIMHRHTQFDHALNEHFDEKKALIESIVKDMVHHRDSAVDSKISQEERNNHDTRMWRELDKLQAQNAEVLEAIIFPEKFALDENNRIVPADGVDLANRYAQTTGKKMTALGDMNNLNRVGRVSDMTVQVSTLINENDTVLSAIKLKQFGDESETNVYAVKAEDGQSWVRAERIYKGSTVAINNMALSLIGINGNKIKHGGTTSADDVAKNILPESLRQLITSRQIHDHKEWLAIHSKEDAVRRYQAYKYVNALSNQTSLSDEMFYASRELLAERIDNRFSVIDLDKKQSALIDSFELIPGTKKNTYSNQEYRGLSHGFIITDHRDNTRQVVGQYLVERTDEKTKSIKKIEAKSFDFTLKEGETQIAIGYDGVSQSDILININPEKANKLIELNHDRLKPVMSEYEGKSYEAKDSIKWNALHVFSAIANSGDIKRSYDPKIDNNFGMEGKHPALLKIQEKLVTPDTDVKVEKTDNTGNLPRRSHN